MALTGPLAANGKQALLGMKIWEEEINAKGGLLGRPVKLVYYDDQSQLAPCPAIYTKLLDVDKVDLVIGPYATVLAAPAMPVVIQKSKVFIILFGLDVNTRVQIRQVLRDDPVRAGHEAVLHRRLLRGRRGTEPRSRDDGAGRADAEFSRNACEGAREQRQPKHGFKVVYDKTYPPATTDFSPIVRAIQATNPDIVTICSYPLDSVGMVKAVNEIGFKPKMIGGAMVGLQATVFKNQLGPLLNGIVNYETWVPSKMMLPSTEEFLKKYQARATAEASIR